ncbi:hypothetical protein BDF20DRAFT_134795 [Mycotypha africana]|uniref:uncharacterized protein n=1 Tax=Mycotypha africana TaxID=64632 RepID=UPI002301BBF9|nr:uncharacterized protein BDF20DRAFT_134795 [Mycotypha africana]KAI8968934.1 hypothetical protein BDF20DRAFT_134795 [Mycotypha africana]
MFLSAANISNHVFSIEFLERVHTFSSQLEYYTARIKIKYVEDGGDSSYQNPIVAGNSNASYSMYFFSWKNFPYLASRSQRLIFCS